MIFLLRIGFAGVTELNIRHNLRIYITIKSKYIHIYSSRRDILNLYLHLISQVLDHGRKTSFYALL